MKETITPMSALPTPETGFVPDSGYTQSTVEGATTLSRHSRFGRLAARSALAFGVFTGGAVGVDVLGASSAHADTVLTQQVYGTGGQGLYLHPSSPTIGSVTSELMPDGTNFDISCWTTGDNVNGDTIWDFGTDEATGNTGYAADYYINTPVTQDNEGPQLTALGLGECGSDTQNVPNSDLPSASVSEYNGQTAANWALANAEDPQVYGSDECTWFVSNALWAGGIPKSAAWTDQGSHDYLHPLPGTVDAWVPQNLKDYIMTTYPQSTFTQLDFSQNSQPEAKPGDIIFYDWGDGNLDHATLVVDDAPGTQYPEVSEWGNVSAAGQSYPSVKQGWTFSRVYNKWIQAAYPGATAYLLHVDTGLDGVQVLGDPNSYSNIG